MERCYSFGKRRNRGKSPLPVGKYLYLGLFHAHLVANTTTTLFLYRLRNANMRAKRNSLALEFSPTIDGVGCGEEERRNGFWDGGGDGAGWSCGSVKAVDE